MRPKPIGIQKFNTNVQSFDWQTVSDELKKIGGWGGTNWTPTVQELKDKAGYLFHWGWGDKDGWEEEMGLKINRRTGEILFDYTESKEYHPHA